MTTTYKTSVEAALLAGSSTLDDIPDEAAADLDRILGDEALFMLNEACRKLRISMPSIYRGCARVGYPTFGSARDARSPAPS
jgi:hypothetical protein